LQLPHHHVPNQIDPACHGHCNSHSSSTASKTLSSVTHIFILTSKLDFTAWDKGVTALICANGLTGHILDPSTPVDFNRPDCIPAPMPILPRSPSAQDLKDLNQWWADDNVAQHVLVSRLGSIPRGLLPLLNIVTCMALSIYRMLMQYYGTCKFVEYMELLNSLHTSFCMPG
jgi:hypothetical protein